MEKQKQTPPSSTPEYIYEYHWGRILLAGSLLLALILTALLIFISGDEPSTPSRALATKESATQANSAVPGLTTSSEQSSVKPPAPTELSNHPEEVATINKLPATAAISKPSSQLAPENTQPNIKTIEREEQPTKIVKQSNHNKGSSETIPANAAKPTEASLQLTRAKLFSETVKRARLTDTVVRHEPGKQLPQTVELNQSGLSKIYFYTEVLGEAGRTHVHYWYHNGQLKAKVPITIGSDRWRCYSSKYLTATHAGNWQVQVKDRKGKLLAQGEFNFRGASTNIP